MLHVADLSQKQPRTWWLKLRFPSKTPTLQEIKVDQDRVKTKLEEVTNRYPKPEEIRKMYEQTPQLMDQIRSAVIEDLVIDWLIERTEFQNKEVEFKELMNRS